MILISCLGLKLPAKGNKNPARISQSVYLQSSMDLELFKKEATEKRDELTAFLQRLDDIVPEDIHTVVDEVNSTVWKDADCTTCANCCKTMTPIYTQQDVARIATHLRMSPKAFRGKWLVKEEDTGDWVNRNLPCQFLVNNMCAIYEVRPADCAEFPHHDKKPFDLYNDTYIQNVYRCPATFLMVSRLKDRVEAEYEW